MKQLTYHEWIEWRRGGLGGSDAPVIKRESPFATPLELFLRRTKRIPPQPVTYPMLRGIRMEPVARRRYEALTGIPMPARLLESDYWPVIRGSFDGLNEDARLAIEIKRPGRKDHLYALNGQVPRKYIWQCVHLLFVCRYRRLDYVSFNEEFEQRYQTAIVSVYRHNWAERSLIEDEKPFWRLLVTDTPPPPGPKEMAWPWPKYALSNQWR